MGASEWLRRLAVRETRRMGGSAMGRIYIRVHRTWQAGHWLPEGAERLAGGGAEPRSGAAGTTGPRDEPIPIQGAHAAGMREAFC